MPNAHVIKEQFYLLLSKVTANFVFTVFGSMLVYSVMRPPLEV